MTLCVVSGSLVTHQYCFLQPNAIGEHGWLPVAWFGVHCHPGRMLGCHVLLECGAVYRNIPLHQLAVQETDTCWTPQQAQTWDCYGREFSVLEYKFLTARTVIARLADHTEHRGKYLCTIIPVGDPWSEHPDQSKEFTLIALDNNRYTAQPTNMTLFEDKSFCRNVEWPSWIRRQTKIWRVE